MMKMLMIVNMFQQEPFEIEGPLRFPLLVLEWAALFVQVELALISLLRYKRRDVKHVQFLAFSCLFAGLAILSASSIISSYFLASLAAPSAPAWSLPDSFPTHLSEAGAVGAMMGGFLFTVFLERQRPIVWRRFIVAGVAAIVLVLFCLSFLVPDLDPGGLLHDLALFTWLALLVATLALFVNTLSVHIEKIAKPASQARRRGRDVSPVNKPLALACTAMMFPGMLFMLPARVVRSLLDITLVPRILGAVLMVVFLAWFFLVIYKIPPIAELDWKTDVESIFLLDKAGICLVHESFSKAGGNIDEHLVTSSVMMINTLLREMTASDKEGLAVIRKKGKTVTTFSGNTIDGVVFSRMDLETARHVIKDVVRVVESKFGDSLRDWDGNQEFADVVKNFVGSYLEPGKKSPDATKVAHASQGMGGSPVGQG